MFKNNFKIAFRNLWKNRTSSLINILGLTIGLTCCILIGIYIQSELSYDNFEQKGDRIVRVIMEYRFGGGTELKKGNFTSTRVAPVFKRTFPEVEDGVRMTKYQEVVQYKDKLINEKSVMYADSSFFNLFSFTLLKGDKNNVLSSPNDVVLTETTANRYFGNDDPIGKTLTIGDEHKLYKVSGIIQDSPSNSQIKFDFLLPFAALGLSVDNEKSYWDANYTTYLLLKDKSSVSSLQAKITPFMTKEMQGAGAVVDFMLEPFSSIHLYSEYDGFEPNSSIAYIHILEAVVIMILLIACFTYVNLSTARSIERAKEVGIRKVIGAEKKQLFWQFIGESVLLCAIATVLSVLIAILTMPVFNQLTGQQLQLSTFFSLQFVGVCLLMVVLVSFMAGSYPALILTNYQPIKVLKGAFKNTGSGQWVRRSLIVFQFSISVALIVSTFIIQKQLHYIQDRKLGYNRDHILVLPMDNKMLKNVAVIKQQFKLNSDILSISRCRSTPVSILGGYNMRSSVMPDNQQIAVAGDPVDKDFVATTGLQIIAGSDYSDQDEKDASGDDRNKNIYHFILNESAAKQLGWTPVEAIGKKMYLDASRPGYVRGVVKDFNFESMHHTIKPLVLFYESRGSSILVKIKGDKLPQTISFLASKWKDLVPYRPFEYHFLDDDFNKLYSSELRLGKILTIFTSIAIALACLGLLGLSAYSARQRVKEIGIRKVLGASLAQIVNALSIDFLKLVVVSCIIAFPLAYYLMENWLKNYAYRTDIQWWTFLIAGFVVTFIALATVGIQSVKAAMANPVKSLRSE